MNWVGLIIGALLAVALCAVAMAIFVTGARSEDESHRNIEARPHKERSSSPPDRARKGDRLH